ncbi:MAG: ribosome biogenesis GTPase YlqF [Streptococcaceae bacterium]|jgi:ribosome biogenesis GTPase A|nr:ribosome biogenesis GTPase YlqF [Streptococcaceae bacterium]
MSSIQWFPGHMAKARREVMEKLKFVDIVFELVDARLPLSSRNPMLDNILQEKPRLVLLNKKDLADERQSVQWANYFKNKGYAALSINAQENKDAKKIVLESKKVLQAKFERERSRGIQPRAIRAMVIGIPNVGKSTLLNRLIGKKIAQTGNKPGVTKGQQWLRHNAELELLDTPGILWPKFEDQEVAKKLALTGAIKDQLLHLDDLAIYALEIFSKDYPEDLRLRFKLTEEDLKMESPELLMKIAQLRGFREDYERASEMIVNEVRSGKIGRFTLDRIGEIENLDGDEDK